MPYMYIFALYFNFIAMCLRTIFVHLILCFGRFGSLDSITLNMLSLVSHIQL